MPTYTYRCPECGFTEEESHKMSHVVAKFCPQNSTRHRTKKVMMRKVPSTFNFNWKEGKPT